MTTDDESHEDEFFRAGTEGTYQGGPGSIVPVEIDDWAEPAGNLPTEEGLERRRRLQRVVFGVVATLSTCLLLAVVVRSGSSHEGSASSHEGTRPVAPVEPSQSDRLRTVTPPTETVQRAPSPAAPASPPAPVQPEQESIAEAPKPPEATAGVREAPAQPTLRAPHPTSPGPRRVRPTPGSVAQRAFPLPGKQFAPPTANFPDVGR